jgi:hypothetical protein
MIILRFFPSFKGLVKSENKSVSRNLTAEIEKKIEIRYF